VQRTFDYSAKSSNPRSICFGWFNTVPAFFAAKVRLPVRANCMRSILTIHNIVNLGLEDFDSVSLCKLFKLVFVLQLKGYGYLNF
jgi:hypothetical protein